MKPISFWNIFARMSFLEKHVKSLNLAGADMAVLEARLDDASARARSLAHRMDRAEVHIGMLPRPPVDDRISKRREYQRAYYKRKKDEKIRAEKQAARKQAKAKATAKVEVK